MMINAEANFTTAASSIDGPASNLITRIPTKEDPAVDHIHRGKTLRMSDRG